jgi:membrane associated rhomboid family serine protease
MTLGAGEWWRLLTSSFVHGNLLHLAMNMFALWQAGQLVERIFGSARFAGLYLLAGIGGSLGSLGWGLLSQHPVNSVGASGAIFGIIGGLLAFIGREAPASCIRTPTTRPTSAAWSAVGWPATCWRARCTCRPSAPPKL